MYAMYSPVVVFFPQKRGKTSECFFFLGFFCLDIVMYDGFSFSDPPLYVSDTTMFQRCELFAKPCLFAL